MLEVGLRRKVDSLWDRFWSGGLANPLMAIDQLNYLIFLKRLEMTDDLAARRARVRNERFVSVFENAESCRWSHWRNMRAEEMHAHVAGAVFPWMKRLSPDLHPFTAFLQDATFLIPKPSLLVEAVGVLDDLRVDDRNTDSLGDVYEWMLAKLNVAGQAGQFRTPRHVIRALVEIVDPKYGEVVVDPACGTGGFLIAAYQHVLGQFTSPEFLGMDEEGAPTGRLGDKLSPRRRATLQATITGFDFDVTMVRIAAMNMTLHGIDRPGVAYADTLGRAFSHAPRAKVILANPPFAGSLDVDDLSEDFARLRTGKTELLFPSLMLDMLLPGGRAAIVVPDGLLFTRQRAYEAVRRRLVEENCLHAVISLPAGVFRPYSGVKTSVLVLTKGGHTEQVWMYRVQSDGYSLDDRRVPTGDSDLPHLLQSWPERTITDRSFLVDAATIRGEAYELAPGTYVEGTERVAEFGDPLSEVERMTDRLMEASKALDELRRLLAE